MPHPMIPLFLTALFLLTGSFACSGPRKIVDYLGSLTYITYPDNSFVAFDWIEREDRPGGSRCQAWCTVSETTPLLFYNHWKREVEAKFATDVAARHFVYGMRSAAEAPQLRFKLKEGPLRIHFLKVPEFASFFGQESSVLGIVRWNRIRKMKSLDHEFSLQYQIPGIDSSFTWKSEIPAVEVREDSFSTWYLVQHYYMSFEKANIAKGVEFLNHVNTRI